MAIKLFQKAIEESRKEKFLIGGLLRSEDNRTSFEYIGREDDNIETIRKRLKVYMESSLPVVKKYYDSLGNLE